MYDRWREIPILWALIHRSEPAYSVIGLAGMRIGNFQGL